MDKKISLLKNIEIFTNLPPSDLLVLSELSYFQKYNQNDLIFEKGSLGRNLYIIDSGEIAINNQLETKDSQEAMARFIPGEIFGEFEFFEGITRIAYARALEKTTLLVFPKEGVDHEHIFIEYSYIFAKIYHNLISLNARRLRRTHKLISEKAGWLDELRKQMFLDKLTGVYNRTYLEDELVRNIDSLGSYFSLLVIKPDNFKLINDTFGHEAGDKALLAISNKIQSLRQKNDQIIRYRGNEFILLLPHTPLAQATSLAEKHLQTLNSFDIGKAMDSNSLFQTFSIGVSAFPDHDNSLLELVEKSFAMVFHQRSLGGNGVQISQNTETEVYEFLKTIDIFSTLKLSELHQVAKHLTPIIFSHGDIICRENDAGDQLYLIKSGKTSVQISLPDGSQKEIAQLISGDFLGEMAIFENAPRSATCQAVSNCEIYSMKKDDFFNLMHFSPNTAIKIMRNMLDITSGRVNASGKFISQMVKWGQEASQRALTDKLTGVYNRRFLESELSKQFDIAKQKNIPFALIMADMDYFREVNEGYSHEIGDQYITEVANVFKATFRPSDIVSRFGGDEFTILMPDTDIATAKAVAEKVCSAVSALDFLDNFPGPKLNLSVSLGLAVYPISGTTVAVLREMSDKALYLAKKNGRNQVVLLTEELLKQKKDGDNDSDGK